MESDFLECICNFSFPGVGQVDKVQVEGSEALVGLETHERATYKHHLDAPDGQCFNDQCGQFSAA